MSYKATLSPDHSSEKYRSQAQHLQEPFPAWSLDDLQSLLVEVAGDVQLAATRISEGKAEPWGAVTRKKDKKPPTSPNPQSRDAFSGRGGDSRGSRGGRGGRGGPGRGGPSRSRGSGPRGGAHTNGRPAPSAHTPGWGHAASPPTESKGEPSADTSAWPGASDQEDAGAWGDPTDTSSAVTSTVVSTSTAVSTSTLSPDADVNGTSAPSVRSLAQTKPPKSPATSKLSWAQIAKPQDKPTPPPAPALVPVPAAPQALSPSSDPPLSLEPQNETPHLGWEEPTTVQPPTWDDEPQAKPSTSISASTSAADVWPEAHGREEEESPIIDQPEMEEEELVPAAPESIPEPQIPPVQLQEPKAEEVATPQTPKHTRPTATSHRSAARYNPRMIDQPVVLPSSVGSGIENVGMQFGSLSLGGESLFDSSPIEPVTPEPVSVAPEPQHQPPQPQSSAHVQARHEPAPAPAPAPSHVGSGSALFHQSLPQQQQHTPPQPVPQPQHVMPTSVSQPSVQVQSSPIQQFAQSVSQQSLASHQQHLAQTQQQQHQVPQNPTQVHAQQHHQYAQHGLPTHIDPSQSQAQHSPQQVSQPQQQNAATHSSYFRQAEPPYFHTPTPPAGPAQETPYSGFGQLGQQGQQQTQGSHLGGFAGDYMYGENQRGFYESYAQQSGFGNRNVLGHDDVKGLPAQQQPPSSAGLPPSNAQSSQQHPPSSQAATQPQPAAGQGPQQGYPPPVPYYYSPYPQNQYYGSPYNSGYVPQPFVKYPTAMFQPGPPGPGSAPSTAAKQPANVQPQSNPYGQGLYGQQHPSASYDDLGYQHHSQQQQQQQQQQHQQHGHAQGVAGNHPSNDYGKYGSHGGQTMQGFMGLGQSTGPTSGPPIGQRTGGGASPETAYKPYAPVKDVGAGVGVGVGQGGVGQGPQGRGGVQQPQHNQGAFYGANRFGSTTAAGPQGQQSQQHQPQNQGHLGYPQGGTEGNFYSYQRQQQGYWQ